MATVEDLNSDKSWFSVTKIKPHVLHVETKNEEPTRARNILETSYHPEAPADFANLVGWGDLAILIEQNQGRQE